MGAARRYAIAVIAVLVTMGVKVALSGVSAEHPFVLLAAPVALAAWYGGLGPGVLSTVLAVIGSLYFFLPPVGTGTEPADLVGVGGLIFEGALVVALTVGLRSARSRAESASAAAVAAHRETTFALAVRDEMLILWTRHLRGPMADLEAQARAALSDLETDGYHGAAVAKIEKLVEDAALVGRASAGWDKDGRVPGADP
ncbi:MAG TPA: DUF4118 domain-containing protein [Candidatus Limnocylindria bacterium]|nr:DUF4118 domain-containing protein [Candidatus Limnocylindria bacterium]